MSLLFYYAMMTSFAVHAILDAICLSITILDPYLYNFLSGNEDPSSYPSPHQIPQNQATVDNIENDSNPLLSPNFNSNQSDQTNVSGTKAFDWIANTIKKLRVSIVSKDIWKKWLRAIVLWTRPQWEYLLKLYPSLMNEDYARDVCSGHIHKTSCRLFMYWIGTMSLVRLMVFIFPVCPLFITLSLIYLFEFLVFQYEGLTLQIFLIPSKAKIMSFMALYMSLFSGLLCIWTF